VERSKILAALPVDIQAKIDLTLLQSVSSTNDYLKEELQDLKIVVAETQTKGRGRFGHTWFSPVGQNIYLSFQRYFKGSMNELSGLSLVVSLALVKTLALFIDTRLLKIKWPNDVLYEHAKLAGTLIEVMPSHRVIIGMGININMMEDNDQQISQAWTSLKKITGQDFNRNEIISALIIHLMEMLPQFEERGLSYFLERWADYDYLMGHKINLKSGSQKNALVTGIARGVNAQGHLLLELEDGHCEAFSSGDTSRVNLVYY
jgi:BirA family biotin operon repressor/biotin-[acetyl-CoA-carboxylase] ligase